MAFPKEDKELLKKSLYVMGEEKYISDFIYLFPGLDVIGIWEKDLEEVIEQEKYLERPIVFCWKRNAEIEKEMGQKKLRSGQDYFFAKEYISLWPVYEIEKRAGKRKIAIWGSGNTGEYFWPYIKELDIECVIDSATEVCSREKWHGMDKVNPNDLNAEFWRSHFILITSVFYDEISAYLTENGQVEFKDFLSWRAIPVEYTDKIIRSIEDAPKISFHCPVSKRSLGLEKGKLYLCPYVGWSDSIGNIFYDTKENILNSVIKRAFEISINNRTNSFCGGQLCDFIFNQNIYGEEEFKEIAGDTPRIAIAAYDDSCNLFCITCRENIFFEKTKQSEYCHKIL